MTDMPPPALPPPPQVERSRRWPIALLAESRPRNDAQIAILVGAKRSAHWGADYPLERHGHHRGRRKITTYGSRNGSDRALRCPTGRGLSLVIDAVLGPLAWAWLL